MTISVDASLVNTLNFTNYQPDPSTVDTTTDGINLTGTTPLITNNGTIINDATMKNDSYGIINNNSNIINNSNFNNTHIINNKASSFINNTGFLTKYNSTVFGDKTVSPISAVHFIKPLYEKF